MRYNAGKKVILMCHHTTTQPLAGGTDVFVLVRHQGQVQRILVRGFPAVMCQRQECRTILTEMDWLLAVEYALEQRLASGATLPPLVAFADLQLTQPATLCA